jgi:hypothetical protein
MWIIYIFAHFTTHKKVINTRDRFLAQIPRARVTLIQNYVHERQKKVRVSFINNISLPLIITVHDQRFSSLFSPQVTRSRLIPKAYFKQVKYRPNLRGNIRPLK